MITLTIIALIFLYLVIHLIATSTGLSIVLVFLILAWLLSRNGKQKIKK